MSKAPHHLSTAAELLQAAYNGLEASLPELHKHCRYQSEDLIELAMDVIRMAARRTDIVNTKRHVPYDRRLFVGPDRTP